MLEWFWFFLCWVNLNCILYILVLSYKSLSFWILWRMLNCFLPLVCFSKQFTQVSCLQVPTHLLWMVVPMVTQFSKPLQYYLYLSCVCDTQPLIWDLGSVLKVLLYLLELDPFRHSTGVSSKVLVQLYMIIFLSCLFAWGLTFPCSPGPIFIFIWLETGYFNWYFLLCISYNYACLWCSESRGQREQNNWSYPTFLEPFFL